MIGQLPHGPQIVVNGSLSFVVALQICQSDAQIRGAQVQEKKICLTRQPTPGTMPPRRDSGLLEQPHASELPSRVFLHPNFTLGNPVMRGFVHQGSTCV